jgi:hypothetical protein
MRYFGFKTQLIPEESIVISHFFVHYINRLIIGGIKMDEQCFYCNTAMEDGYYYGSFQQSNELLEKPLCRDCYKEWLEGIKE